MPLTLIYGPTGSQKTFKVIEQADLFIVPTESKAFGLRQALLEKSSVLLGEKTLPFNLFVKKLADTQTPVISLRGQTLLLHHLLSKGRLNYFKSASLGVAKEAAHTITALKRNFISFRELNRLLVKPNPREKDLSLLYEYYEKEKEFRCILDEGDLFFIAANKIKDKNIPFLDDIKYLAFDEFDFLTPGQIHLIEILSQNLRDKEIVVSLTTTNEPSSPYASYLENILNKLKKISNKVHPLKVSKKHSTPKVENIVLRSPVQETQFIINEITSEIKRGTPPERIGVILRSGDQTIFEILEGLKDLGISPPINSPITHEILSEVFISLPSEADISDFTAQLRSNLRRIYKDNPHDLSLRSLQALYAIDEILRSQAIVSQTLKLKKISRETFWQIFFDECSSFFLSSAQLDSICPLKFINYEDGITNSLDVVFIPQVIEGHMPSLPRDNIFFSMEGRKGFNHQLNEVFPDSSFYLAYESFLFKRLISKSLERVIITHAAIDEKGKETAPSSFLDPFEKSKPHVAPVYLKDKQNNPSFIKHLSFVAQVEQERSFGLVTNPSYHGHLKDKKVRDMIKKRFEEESISPTQIEAYAGCPFKFFAQSVLNLRPLEEITPEIQPRDLGTIIHAILDRFYRNHDELFKKALINPKREDEIRNIIKQIVEEVFKDNEQKISYAAAGLRPYEKDLARLMAIRVIVKELDLARSLPSPLFPFKCEWVFGKDNKNLFKLDMKGQSPLFINGRVDRVDATSDKKRFAVVDYKTGKNVSSIIGRIKKGLHVQLPLYVEAARKLLLPKALAVGGILLAVKKAEKKHGFLKKDFNNVHYSISARMGSILDNETWEEVSKEALKAARKHVTGIREANFKIEPKECPNFCDYADVCRYNKKAADHISTESN